MRFSTLIFGFWISIFYGCTDNTPEPKKLKEESNISPDKNISIIKEKLKSPNTECKEVNIKSDKKSNCNRGVISEKELKNSKNRQGGIHTLKSIRGKTIHIIEKPTGFLFPEYEDKVILLEFFGKDCPHCLKELPIIKQIRRDYRGKLEVIAVQAQDRMSLREAQAYINGNNIRYPIIEGQDALNLQHFVQQTYGWTGILPYTLVIKDGVTEFFYAGEFKYEDIKKDLNSILKD